MGWLVVHLIGVAFNRGIFGLVQNALGSIKMKTFLALMIGSVMAMFWNVWAMRRFVFVSGTD